MYVSCFNRIRCMEFLRTRPSLHLRLTKAKALKKALAFSNPIAAKCNELSPKDLHLSNLTLALCISRASTANSAEPRAARPETSGAWLSAVASLRKEVPRVVENWVDSWLVSFTGADHK